MSSSARIPQGLPSNPRSRVASRPTPPTRQAESPRTSRTHLPIPSNPRPRNPSAQRATVQDTTQRNVRPQQRYDNDGMVNRRGRWSEDTTSTSSSSSAPTWPRVRHSPSSSRTTLQSDDGIGSTGQQQSNREDDSRHNNSYYDATFTWRRVTEAATMITQEVSKVWASGLTSQGNGDEDEEGETQLTRVMRAYHLAKARTPSELPAWLFSEKERGQGGLLRSDRTALPDDSQVREQTQRRNRPAYGDNTTIPGAHAQKNKDIQNTKPISSNGPTKISGADRLKQMRELRRNASRV
ncbi:hypothetical protein JR316_0003778 [Psilocybe cubensis]|uniref:Uncharacterized protein n=2 Tax=Psilocybe cubensis TaxID=181762 RepID=A0ACB8H9F3_PSICU|nr:hypothetical protein JR316_0003778 [Psilocybe cubensis]KAH9484297.1 hypothetical protein JR316_0003778 [Psilocybe cubensis]